MSRIHYPVMLRQISSLLSHFNNTTTKPFSMIDCTIGTGGHSLSLLQQYPNLYILGLDLDQRMIRFLNNQVLPTVDVSIKNRLKLVNQSYTQIYKYQSSLFQECKNNSGWDAILADFGYNSLHLLDPDWGFSYLKDGDLDMRYNPKYKKCSEIIAEASQIQLIQILCKYGQIDKTTSSIIVKGLIGYRNTKPIRTTKQIQEIINSTSIRSKFKFLIKVFQALRIFTNEELTDVQKVCSIIPQKLSREGKGMVVTFHSLQEEAAKAGFSSSKQSWKGMFKLNSVVVDEAEVQENSASRSAKMLVMEPKMKKRQKGSIRKESSKDK